MKNHYYKHLQKRIKMSLPNEGEANISVTHEELRAAIIPNKAGKQVLCHNLGPNRKARREELKKEKHFAVHYEEDDRAIINNRGNAGQRVFEKMAYFHFMRNAKVNRSKTGR